VLQKVGRRVRSRLDALFVVNVHVQIGTVLLGERNAFIVDERGVLNRRDPRPDRILDAFGRMRVRFDAHAEIAGLFDGGAPMGRDANEGVANSYGEVFGYPGLYVADGSLMPGPVGPNPDDRAHIGNAAATGIATTPAQYEIAAHNYYQQQDKTPAAKQSKQ